MKHDLARLFALSIIGCTEPAAPLPAEEDPEDTWLTVAEDLDPAPGRVKYRLTMMEHDIELLPGQRTLMWTYDGVFPGPLLQAEVGDEVEIEVLNILPEATTIHWHGLRITPDMDGVAHGHVHPIATGEGFTYRFTVPDAGTFWYHPHVRARVQVEAGLYGMFIVREPAETAPQVDADRAFIIDDIRLTDDGAIASHASGGHDIMMGRAGDVFLVDGRRATDESPAGYVFLGAGTAERWRLLNTCNARTLELRFSGLEVREIGADGGLWRQSDTRSIGELVLPVGARSELEVRLRAGEGFGIMSLIDYRRGAFGNVVRVEVPLVRVHADASRDRATPSLGHTADPTYEVLADAAAPITHQLMLDLQDGRFTINGFSFPEYEPWTVAAGGLELIEVVDNIGLEHPFHLHGQFFQVVSRGGAPAEEPGWRDTTLVEPGSRFVIASRFENPGLWMYHCHILEHAEFGMMGFVDVTQ